jgi:hypothetical protein
MTPKNNTDLREALNAVEYQLMRRPTRVHSVREWWITVLALFCSVGLHSLIFAPLVFGTDSRAKRAPERQGLGSSAIVASAEMVPTLTFIPLSPTTAPSEEPLPELASRGIAEPQFSLIVASPDPNLAFDVEEEEFEKREDDSATESAAGVGPERALLFGRYMGQLDARIQRAWMRPRTPIGAKRFECRTRIEQDEAGNVLSVELLNCNGDAGWQRSLVSAIQRASPLSAPPEPSVVSPTLLLSFDATEYQAGVSNENEYEPVIQLAQVEGSAPLQTISNPDTTIEDIRKHEGNVELTIVGKKTTWTLNDLEPPLSETEDVTPAQYILAATGTLTEAARWFARCRVEAL